MELPQVRKFILSSFWKKLTTQKWNIPGNAFHGHGSACGWSLGHMLASFLWFYLGPAVIWRANQDWRACCFVAYDSITEFIETSTLEVFGKVSQHATSWTIAHPHFIVGNGLSNRFWISSAFSHEAWVFSSKVVLWIPWWYHWSIKLEALVFKETLGTEV